MDWGLPETENAAKGFRMELCANLLVTRIANGASRTEKYWNEEARRGE